MTAQQVLQIAVGCIAATTPWLVARIALAVATRHANDVGAPFGPPRPMTTLTRATIALLPLVVVAGWSLPPPSLLMSGVDAAVFVLLSVFGLRALHEIESASRPAREVQAAERSASLRPRRLADYVPTAWHAVPFVAAVIGVALLAWRLGALRSGRLLVPVSFILAAPIFLWLYETWMRSEIAGDGSIDFDHQRADERRRHRVRRILTIETVLVVGFVGLGHALLGLDPGAPDARVLVATVAGALLGVTGCALALSSELSRRRFRLRAGS